jgi:hypothetical protein
VTEPLVILAPLREGHADAARAAIRALREPFADVPGTHLARLQILRPRARRFRGRPRAYVLLGAEHDGPRDEWLAAAAPGLEAVFAHCAFWPGAGDRAAVAQWASDHELRVGFSVVGAPDATVDEVRRALDLRARLAALALEAEGLGDAALQARWRAL